MNLKFLATTLCVGFSTLSLPLYASGKRGISLGLSSDLYAKGYYGGSAEIQSPSFADWEKDDYFGLLTGYLWTGSVVTNQLYQENGLYQDLQNDLWGFGLSLTSLKADNPTVASHFMVGWGFLKPDSKLADKSSSGFRFSFGVNIFTGGSLATVLGAFLVQANWQYGLEKANLIAGEPDIFNGLSLSLGSQIFW